jgi:hypothetical protein
MIRYRFTIPRRLASIIVSTVVLSYICRPTLCSKRRSQSSLHASLVGILDFMSGPQHTHTHENVYFIKYILVNVLKWLIYLFVCGLFNDAFGS